MVTQRKIDRVKSNKKKQKKVQRKHYIIHYNVWHGQLSGCNTPALLMCYVAVTTNRLS